MIQTPSLLIPEAPIRHTLLAAESRARAIDQPVLASVSVPLADGTPLQLFQRAATIWPDRFYWERPSEHFSMAGLGMACIFDPPAATRFADITRHWGSLIERAVIAWPVDAPGVGPVLMGGFSFDPLRPADELWNGYPAALLVLPFIHLTKTYDSLWLTINVVVQPYLNNIDEIAALLLEACTTVLGTSQEPQELYKQPSFALLNTFSPDTWKKMVAATVADIRNGLFEKVVLTHCIVAKAEEPLKPVPMLERLRAEYPEAAIFAVAHAGRCFLGASPERLAWLRTGRAEAWCLAGSITRGKTPDEDEALAHQLLRSGKDRAEHDIVLHMIRETLTSVCTNVQAPSEPQVLRLHNVQHLYTPVTGEIMPGYNLIDLVARLHPTPAVGGYPRERALHAIREREVCERGWYAGPIGWLDRYGEGEFAVAIRSTLLIGPYAAIFGGCGIVADSDPESEYQEAMLKMEPIFSALGAR
jgi:isochorismate synthase